MTQSTRTLAEITKSRAFLAQAIEQVEATLSEVRGLAVTNTIYVLGWVAYGLYLNSKDTVGGLMFARKFDNAHTPSRMTVSNGKGERASVVTLGRAREALIEQMEGVLTMLEGQLQDVDAERDDAEFAAAEAAKAEAIKANPQLFNALEDVKAERDIADALRAELMAMTIKAAKTERELARHRRAVEVALEFLDDRADADCDQDGYIPNDELRASSDMRAILVGIA